jgi:hypothetical protein
MMRTLFAAATASLMLAAPASAQNDCGSVQGDYNRAIDQISDRMELYAKCVNESQGHDDCSLQFKQLEKAHRRFDEAVMTIGFRCRPERRGKSGEPDGG